MITNGKTPVRKPANNGQPLNTEKGITINPANFQDVGDNLRAAIVGHTLVILVDTTKDFGKRKAKVARDGTKIPEGKMNAVANSHGIAALPGNLQGNLYVGKYLGRDEPESGDEL